MTENERKQAIAQLAGGMAEHLIQQLTDPAACLAWRDAVYAASLAIKAVGLVAMSADAEPLTLEQTLPELQRIFNAALEATVVPVMDDGENGPLRHQYHTRQ